MCRATNPPTSGVPQYFQFSTSCNHIYVKISANQIDHLIKIGCIKGVFFFKKEVVDFFTARQGNGC